jgi:hypothetical protein
MEDLAGAVNNLPELRLVSRPIAEQGPEPSQPTIPLDADLSRLVDSWPRLSDPIRRAIIAVLDTSQSAPSNP